jgi:hypothetical protein
VTPAAVYRTPRLRRTSAHPVRICAVGVLCALLSAFGVSAAESVDTDTENDSGPTIKMSYTRATFEQNPIGSFMYFVPLIALSPVERYTSADNVQEVGIVSYSRQMRSRSFQVVCDFEIRGAGFHKNSFEPAGLIERLTQDLKPNDTLKGVLDYVVIEGEGLGRIEVKGTMNGSTADVTEVNLRFNARRRQSPVTIGLYDIAPTDGEYVYENRSNEVVVRVNTLEFKKDGGTPTMDIGVASISKANGSEGFFARIRGVVANLLITPPTISEIGNETMLDLGYAVLNQDAEFTFPVARNLQKDAIVDRLEP